MAFLRRFVGQPRTVSLRLVFRTVVPPNSRCQSTSTVPKCLPLSESSVQGSSEPPLITNTLYGYFDDTILRLHSERPALICRGERPRPHGGPQTRNSAVGSHLIWNFAELNVQVKALARGLVGLGVKKGDRVGVIMGNNRCVSRCSF